MWCEKCNLETEYEKCPECHSDTVPVPENGVYWCSECKIPIMKEPRKYGQEQADIICPICGKTAGYLASDMRPVFPEERLLVELLLNKKPHTYINSSVWASNNRYYIDGKSVSISTKHFQNADTDRLRELLTQNQASNSYEAFNRYMLIAEFNSILEDRFEPMHRLTAAQQNIVLALYHGKSVACNAPSGSMKNVMLYLLALKEHQSNGKQTLLTAEAHLQENELVLADRLGLKGGIISTMAEFLADYKKDKYDIIFVSYEFFRKHENIAPFVDYFTNKVAYWGLDHPASAQDIWMQLNNCGVALDAVMFLMDKVGFGDLNLSNYQRIDIAGTADLGVVKKHTLFAPEEKLRWILANLDELSGQGLIYCDDEVTCKSLSKSLRKNKVMAEAYIDVNNPEKKEHINYLTNAFTSGGLPILVTTHEAGKNLSNPHIRFIIHYDIPEDQELYQLHATQIGRLVTDAVVHDLLVV